MSEAPDHSRTRLMREVEAVNEAFYAAFESADLDAMQALWLDDPDALCVHPGALPVRGTGQISRSWAVIMANTPYIQFFLTDVEVSVREDVASVTCTENVLTGDASTGPGRLRRRPRRGDQCVRSHTGRLALVDPPCLTGTVGGEP